MNVVRRLAARTRLRSVCANDASLTTLRTPVSAAHVLNELRNPCAGAPRDPTSAASLRHDFWDAGQIRAIRKAPSPSSLWINDGELATLIRSHQDRKAREIVILAPFYNFASMFLANAHFAEGAHYNAQQKLKRQGLAIAAHALESCPRSKPTEQKLMGTTIFAFDRSYHRSPPLDFGKTKIVH